MAYIRTDEVAAIRGQLKAKFPQLKFSVRKQHHSSVIVTIKSGTVDFSDILDDNGYAQTNQYWLNRMGQHQELFEEIYEVVKTAPASVPNGRAWFDESDSMTDYFHTAFYMSVNIGSYDRPYVCSKPKPKAAKLPKYTPIGAAAESVARMTQEEQDRFVEDIVSRYPNLADSLMTKLGFGLLAAEEA
jgi:hypothetical protein